MEEEQKRLEELMRLYGLEEKEARAAYHLGLAEELFEEISEDAYRRSGSPAVRGVHAWMHDEMDFGEHFQALRNQLARRVLQRDYPEGWGVRPSSDMRGGYSAEEARRLAESMLPDILPYDPTRPVGYPDNGRLLTDDVGDYVLAILTNGRVTEDKVGPHEDFLSEFPDLGPPHEDRTGA